MGGSGRLFSSAARDAPLASINMNMNVTAARDRLPTPGRLALFMGQCIHEQVSTKSERSRQRRDRIDAARQTRPGLAGGERRVFLRVGNPRATTGDLK